MQTCNFTKIEKVKAPIYILDEVEKHDNESDGTDHLASGAHISALHPFVAVLAISLFGYLVASKA